MALDLGSKRVGVAVADELGLTAQGVAVLERKPHADFMAALSRLTREYGVTRLVLGLPRRMDGTMGPEAQRVMSLAGLLRKELELEVETWDERLSTVAVQRVLIEADLSRRKRKTVVDKVAAVYILQSYLDYLIQNPQEA